MFIYFFQKYLVNYFLIRKNYFNTILLENKNVASNEATFMNIIYMLL